MSQPSKEESTFAQYCQVSSCAGVIDGYSSTHKCGKIFWILTIAAALGLTAFQTYDMFREYLNDGQGQFQSKVELVTFNNDTPFPAVTICNFNRAMKSKLERDGVDQRVFEYAYGAIPETYSLMIRSLREQEGWRTHVLPEYERAWTEYAKKIGQDRPNIAQMLRQYGHGCNGTLLRESFNGFEIEKSLQCKAVGGGMEEVLTSYGRCWRFNLTKSQMRWKTQTRPGPSGGLRFMLNPAIYEYPDDMVINNFMQEGIVLSIDFTPEPYFSNPIVLQPGIHAFISIQAMHQKYTEENYPMFPLPCRENTSLEYVNEGYTPSNCRLDCLAKATATLYHCVPLLEPKNNYDSCTPNETINHVMQFFDGSDAHWIDEDSRIPGSLKTFHEYIDCQKDCINNCDGSTTYSTTISYAEITGEHSKKKQQEYAASALPIFSERNMSVNDLIDVEIFAPVLQYTQIEISEETSIFTFIGNVGGNLGLYTGVCIMSIIQAIYYLIAGLIRRRATNVLHPIMESKTPIVVAPNPMERRTNRVLYIK